MNNKEFLKFVNDCGISVKDGAKLDKDSIAELVCVIRSNFEKGKDACDKLQAINSYDPQADARAMGMCKPAADHANIESFRVDPVKGFCVGHAVASGSISSADGIKLNIETGKDYCMTWNNYASVNSKGVIFRPSTSKFEDIYKQYNGEDLSYKKLFVWREGGIGDLLFIRPILAHLKKKYPTCKIEFATKAIYEPMVGLWKDAIDALHPVPFCVQDTIDMADYHCTLSGLIERCKDAETTDVHDLFAKYMGLDPDEIEWTLPMPTTSNNKFFMSCPVEYAVVQANASSPIRQPRLSSIVAAVDAITEQGLTAIVADSPWKSRQVDDIISLCKLPHKVINFAAFSESIQDAVKLVHNAKLVVAPDSSFVHIAAMQGVPCVGMYGPFPGYVRTERYPKCVTVETPRNDVCKYGGRECFTHSHLRCEYRENCWDNLNNEELIRKITEQLKRYE